MDGWAEGETNAAGGDHSAFPLSGAAVSGARGAANHGAGRMRVGCTIEPDPGLRAGRRSERTVRVRRPIIVKI